MAEEHRTRLTKDVHDALVAAFRLHPGQIGKVARLAGVHKRTAKKAWEQGLPYDWGRTPIREVIEGEQRQARALLAAGPVGGGPPPPAAAPANDAEVGEDGPRPKKESRAVLVARRAVETRAQEAQLVDLTRSNVIVVTAISAQMYETAAKLAERLRGAVEERYFRTDESGVLVPLSLEEIREGMVFIQKLVAISGKAAVTGDVCMDMERKLLGEDASAAGAITTVEEAVRELAESKAAFERVEKKARERGGLHLVTGSGAA